MNNYKWSVNHSKNKLKIYNNKYKITNKWINKNNGQTHKILYKVTKRRIQ